MEASQVEKRAGSSCLPLGGGVAVGTLGAPPSWLFDHAADVCPLLEKRAELNLDAAAKQHWEWEEPEASCFLPLSR